MSTTIDRVNYPFVPGQYGIPPEAFQRTNSHREVVSGSGCTLVVFVSERSICVEDESMHDFRLIADVTPEGSLNFLLATKIGPKFCSIRHPDMYAGRFVKCAVQYFDDQGIPMPRFVGIWHPDSNNYHDYFEQYRLHQDKVRAAKMTWSGRTLGQCGFTDITETDIKIGQDPILNKDYIDKNYIQAVFRRTIPSSTPGVEL